MRNKSMIAVIIGLIALVSAVLAQQAAKPAEPKYTEINYSADMSSYRWAGNDRILALKGNVKFAHGDTVLTADKVDYLESTRTANASGNLKIVDDQNTITGNQCIVNFKEKKGSITGNVHMVSKPKPGGTADSNSIKSQLKDETVTTCSSVDYYYKEKKAVIPSPVTIVQKTRTITADSATYFGKEEKAILVGNVKGRDEKDRHTFAAPKVTISLKESDQWMEAEKASGSFYVKDEEESPKPEEKPAVESPAAKP